jgi:hypothetical protein
MRVCISLFSLAVLFGVLADGSQGGDRPKILAADQREHRLLLIDRDSNTVVAQNHELSRTDCIARWNSNEFLVCDGPTLVRIDKTLNIVTRLDMPIQRASTLARTGTNSILVGDNVLRSLTELDLSRKTPLWSVDVHWPQAAVRLGSGNTLVADGTTMLKEFDRAGQLVRTTALNAWAASLHRLATGEILVGESGAYELFGADGAPLWSRDWTGNRVTCIEALPSGEVLLCDPDARRIVIVDRGGAIAWANGDVGFVWSALYLP